MEAKEASYGVVWAREKGGRGSSAGDGRAATLMAAMASGARARGRGRGVGGSGSMERVRERCVLAYERDKDGMGGDARRERARAAFVANLTTATTHERESREHAA